MIAKSLSDSLPLLLRNGAIAAVPVFHVTVGIQIFLLETDPTCIFGLESFVHFEAAGNPNAHIHARKAGDRSRLAVFAGDGVCIFLFLVCSILQGRERDQDRVGIHR
jgi:hypothetical protein